MHVLDPVTPHTVAAALHERLAMTVRPDEVDLRAAGGWRWVAVLPDGYIAFIPRAAAGVVRLARERAVLHHVAKQVWFRVPVPVIDEPDTPIDVRRMVPSVPDWESVHEKALADRDRGIALGGALGSILAGLHGSTSPEDAEQLGLDLEPGLPRSPAQLAPALEAVAASTRPSVERAIAAYAAALRERPDRVLCHGDFGSHNVAFDPATEIPWGLFDFEAIAYVDRHVDLMYLPLYGEAIMHVALHAYEAETGVRPSPRRIRVLHAAAALSYLAWRVEDPVGHDAHSGRDAVGAVSWVRTALEAI